MNEKVRCAQEPCTECRDIVVRVYDELRRAGSGDRSAFQSALHVLKLRHPGHGPTYYRDKAAHWIDSSRAEPLQIRD
jgi:hypothetical protein